VLYDDVLLCATQKVRMLLPIQTNPRLQAIPLQGEWLFLCPIFFFFTLLGIFFMSAQITAKTAQNQAAQTNSNTQKQRPFDVPLPIVNFSRAAYVLTLLTAFVLGQPLLTTGLLLVVLLGVLGGAEWNVLSRLGRIVLGKRIAKNPAVPLEDARLLRFLS
jgi:hypothetical protein